ALDSKLLLINSNSQHLDKKEQEVKNDVPAEEFKIYSNPLCDEDKINSDKLVPYCFNVESDFVESLLNRDTFIDFSSKFDFSGEIAHIKPEIPKSDFDFEEEIRLIENLLYDNSSPRPPEAFNAEIAEMIIESISSSLIPIQDNESQLEEIDIATNMDDDPSFSRPPSEPPDDEFDLEPGSGKDISAVVNKDVFDDENDDYCSFMFVIQFFLPCLIFTEISSLFLSAESEDIIFDPGLSPGD
nr:hypothetical protein [Tanacetum cinerariifolium]